MCQTIPAQILEIKNQHAIARDCYDREKQILIGAISKLKINDWVLIHANLAISKIDQKEALELKKIFIQK